MIHGEDGKIIEYYPFGVVRLRGFVSADEAEAVYTECKLGRGGAYQRSQILENEAWLLQPDTLAIGPTPLTVLLPIPPQDGHPDQIYNDFEGHANMCLHWNYYNGPVPGQPAPAGFPRPRGPSLPRVSGQIPR